ncbi:MAG: FAD/NAD(P)-binding protein [Lactobacillaceae bacterium]|jgi:hypothetical protein|nr:FAD/NAD(P)-binding protein [Lactobacillaceae bacterium]
MQIALIGAGPRNLTLLERLLAYAQQTTDEIKIKIYDPFPIGGRVWNPDQDPTFLMNTVTQQLTLFTDPSIPHAEPSIYGPDFYEWAKTVGPEFLKAGKYKNEAVFMDEIARINPNRFTSRALFGVYAQWFYAELLQQVPDNVTVTYTPVSVTDVQPNGEHSFYLMLADGITAIADYVVMALGHTDVANTDEEQLFADLAAHNQDITYVPAGHPSEADLASVPAGQDVLLRGLGLSFFDYIAKLTIGRGGRYARDNEGRLYYIPSGNEPDMIAGSRSGLPMHARGVNQKKDAEVFIPKFFTQANLDKYAAEHDGQVKFDYFFNLIEREMTYKHYANTISDFGVTWPFNAAEFMAALETADDMNATARKFGIPEDYIMDWNRILSPVAELPDGIDYDSFMVNYLTWDINDARQGNVDAPYAGAFDMLRDVRGIIRHYLDAGYLNGEEYAQFLRTFNPFNSIISVGPPVIRVEQMRALIEAGILTVTAPGLKVTIQDDKFVATDSRGGSWLTNALVEARLHGVNLLHASDTLVTSLRDQGVFSNQVYQRADGSEYTVGGIRMNKATTTVINAENVEIPGLYIWGVPTEGWSWFTTFAPRPGVNDKNLRDAEHIAADIFK